MSGYHKSVLEEELVGLRASWTERMVCRRGLLGWSPIAEPVPRRLVSASFENASRIRDFGSVRIFGHDGPRGNGSCAPQKVDPALIARFRLAMFGCF